MVKFILSLCLLLPALSSFAQTAEQTSPAQTRFITDDLYTFIHAGPGRNYRILGSITAGSQVSLLNTSEDNSYVEIMDDKQRTGWVDARFVSEQQSLRLSIPSLQQQLEQTQGQIQSYQVTNEELNQQLTELQSKHKTLQQNYQKLQQLQQQTRQKLETTGSEEQQEWLIKGGVLALVSLLLGVILTFLPKRRRRNDNWM